MSIKFPFSCHTLAHGIALRRSPLVRIATLKSTKPSSYYLSHTSQRNALPSSIIGVPTFYHYRGPYLRILQGDLPFSIIGGPTFQYYRGPYLLLSYLIHMTQHDAIKRHLLSLLAFSVPWTPFIFLVSSSSPPPSLFFSSSSPPHPLPFSSSPPVASVSPAVTP